MLETIGNAAGHIWGVLAETDEPVAVTELAKKADLKSPIAYQALGWLAREGKITFHKEGQKVLVSLCEVACPC